MVLLLILRVVAAPGTEAKPSYSPHTQCETTGNTQSQLNNKQAKEGYFSSMICFTGYQTFICDQEEDFESICCSVCNRQFLSKNYLLSHIIITALFLPSNGQNISKHFISNTYMSVLSYDKHLVTLFNMYQLSSTFTCERAEHVYPILHVFLDLLVAQLQRWQCLLVNQSAKWSTTTEWIGL